jgi:molybdopterin molybdotransferase/putative molybdopterin biosynthesis protein
MVQNRLKELREQRGIKVAHLARQADVQRQTIYAIEGGAYVPNTAVALRLAQILEVPVEDLFRLTKPLKTAPRRLRAEILSQRALRPEASIRLGCIEGRNLGVPVEAGPESLPWADGVVRKRLAKGHVEIEALDDPATWQGRLLLAGCDPAVSLLTHQVERAMGGDVVVAPCSSRQALEWLKGGKVHVAGTHLRDPKSGDFNLPDIHRLFADGEVTVFTFARWEEGFVTAAGNPKSIRGFADLVRKDVTLINRDAGAGSRLLLDQSLRALGITAAKVNGYKSVAYGHLEAAGMVRAGSGDVCIATRLAAKTLGLDFTPIDTERYDLAVRRSSLHLPAVQALLDSLNRLALRKKLTTLAGYDTAETGTQLC